MRKIKFRAWIKEDKEMVEVYNINFVESTINDNLFGFDDVILMQYTGLKDKNGKEIYEGDIVKNVINGSILRVEFGTWGITFINGEGQSVFPKNNGKLELEVIGNIYENPELLER